MLRALLPVLLFVCIVSCATAPKIKGSAPPEVLGVWEREVDGSVERVAILPRRVIRVGEQGTEIQLTKYGPSGLWSYFYGRANLSALALEGHQLRYGDALYACSAVAVEALEPRAIELPADPGLGPEQVDAIRSEVLERTARDQGIRAQLGEEWDAEVVGEMLRIDADNTARMHALLPEVGWIDAERFGPEAARGAFLIVQHSGDIPLMLTAREKVRADWEAGLVSGSQYALLHDRLELMLGRPQVYGSQVQSSTDEDGNEVSCLAPLTDLHGLDERRAALGMGPIADYLAQFSEEDVEPFAWPE
ncbi:MAG: DUF6624 domain-containing protein [Planctomycetota bacterium]